MTANYDHLFPYALLGTFVVWLGVVLWGGLSKHIGPRIPAKNDYNASLRNRPWYRKLNPGAMIFTPVWLFFNGFWISLLVYLLLSELLPVLAVAWSIFLLFFGTRMSWGDGSRWGNDLDRFENEQFFWSLLAVTVVVVIAFLSFVEHA